MARLGKRERANKRERELLTYAQGIRARAVPGDRSLTRSNLANLMPIGSPKVDWSYNWKTARRVKNNGHW
jgi:hypothetical protein